MITNLKLNGINLSNKLNRINFLFLFITIGVLSALLYHETLDLLGFDFPHNTFLFNPVDRFNDWHNSIFATTSLNPYFSNSPAVSTYFPFSYWLFSFFTFNGRDVNTSIYLIISISLLIFALYCSWHYLFCTKIDDVNANPKKILLLFTRKFL
jgi:hypothetical protein